MNKEALENRKAIADVKMALAVGEISYDEAKKKISPILNSINVRGKEIAKKYGKNYRPITFTEVIR